MVIDTTLTPSARYADFLLPSCMNLEEHDWTSDGDSNIAYVIFDNKCIEPLGEARSIYDICAGVARELGVETQFTEGRTQYQWLEALYEKSRKAVPELPPTLEEAFKMGVVKKYFPENHIAYKDFREDPEAHPLPSPSGKIEIYSPRLAARDPRAGLRVARAGPAPAMDGFPDARPCRPAMLDPGFSAGRSGPRPPAAGPQRLPRGSFRRVPDLPLSARRQGGHPLRPDLGRGDLRTDAVLQRVHLVRHVKRTQAGKTPTPADAEKAQHSQAFAAATPETAAPLTAGSKGRLFQ